MTIFDPQRKPKLEFFDTETAPLPMAELRAIMPEFQAPKGWKDEDKIRAEVEKKEAAWLNDAALSPLTGQILAAVWVDLNGKTTIIDADVDGEDVVLEFLFESMSGAGMGASYKVGGFNIADFDIPFMVRRAWVNGVKIPNGLIKGRGRWFDLPTWMFDIRHLWSFGDKFAKGTLGDIAEFLGVGKKAGDGADFHRNWRDPVMHAEAEAYLLNDGILMPSIMDRLLLCSEDAYGLNLSHTAR